MPNFCYKLIAGKDTDFDGAQSACVDLESETGARTNLASIEDIYEVIDLTESEQMRSILPLETLLNFRLILIIFRAILSHHYFMTVGNLDLTPKILFFELGSDLGLGCKIILFRKIMVKIFKSSLIKRVQKRFFRC